jgi:hypothetical protein
MKVTLPPAPKNYDVRDQNEVRRALSLALREIERRLRALELGG